MNLIGYDSDYHNQTYRTFPIKKKSKSISGKKKKLYTRDKGICQLCKHPVSFKEISLDHITPKSKGGSNDFYNLQIAHDYCNCIKGSDEQREPEYYINNPLYASTELIKKK